MTADAFTTPRPAPGVVAAYLRRPPLAERTHPGLCGEIRDRALATGWPVVPGLHLGPDLLVGDARGTGVYVITDRAMRVDDVRASLGGAHPTLVGLVLVTTHSALVTLPAVIYGRPVHVLYLARGTR